MDNAHSASGYVPDVASRAGRRPGSGLRLVDTGIALATPAGAAHPAWDEALTQLLGWLGVARNPAPASAAPQFAPWLCHSPVALQAGATADLPQGDWMASYLFDFGSGRAARSDTLDLLLMSPHPAAALSEAATMAIMLDAARAEGRSALAVIVGAAGREAMADQLHAEQQALAAQGCTLEILSLEQALPGLMASRPRWQGVVVAPGLRSTVFALLAETHGIKGPWPLLWYHGDDLAMVCAESLHDAGEPLPLDAAMLVQALVIALRHAGKAPAAQRLYEAWAQQRDSGVVTASRGSPAPYVTCLSDQECVQLLCSAAAVGRRPSPPWGALAPSRRPGTDRVPVRLSVVAPSVASRCPFPAS